MTKANEFSNTPFWHDDIDLSVATTSLEQVDDDYDVLIVGSGFTGLSAALSLARAGKSVVIMEAQDIASGASSRNGGLLGPSFHKLGLQGLIDKFGHDTANAVLQESLKGFDWLLEFIEKEQIDCDLQRCGRFRGAIKQQHFKSLCVQAESLAKALDYPIDIIEKSQQHQEVGTDKYQGGIVYKKDACLHPAKLVKGLIGKCQQAGVTLVAQAAVSHIKDNYAGFTVTVEQRQINAGAVLIASNGYTQDVTADLKKRVLPIRSSMIATAPLSKELMASISPKLRTHGGTDRLVFYYRPSPDGQRMLFGGRALSMLEKPAEYHHFLRQSMLNLFPQLNEVPITHAWSGLVAYSFDHVPHLGLNNGLYYAMGYCGSGVARANYLGHKIALKMLGEDGSTVFDQFEFPSKCFYSGNPWFMPAVLRWHSFADRWGF